MKKAIEVEEGMVVLKPTATRVRTKATFRQLEEAGFVVTQTGDDVYTLKSTATGATLNTKATERDLVSYLTCMKYVREKHRADMNEKFKYVIPVHKAFTNMDKF